MEEFFLKIIKRKKLLIIIAMVIFALTYVSSNYKDVIGLWHDVRKVFAKKSVEDIKYSFLMFPDKELYDSWNSDLNYKLGIPTFSRNALTDKIDTSFKTSNTTEWIPHPNKIDKRGVCSFTFNSSTKHFVDSISENKYHFEKITLRQAEEIGFVSDEINYNHRNICKETLGQFNKIDEKEFYSYIKRKKNYKNFTGISFDIFGIFQLPEESRNKYIMDFGLETDKNRISCYFNVDNELCFRVIDDNSNMCILHIADDLNNKKIHLNFQYNEDNNTLQVKINNSKSVRKKFSDMDFDMYSTKSFTLGNSLHPFYGAKMEFFYIDFEHVMYIPFIAKHLVTNIAKFDYKEPKNIYYNSIQSISKIKNDELKYEIY